MSKKKLFKMFPLYDYAIYLIFLVIFVVFSIILYDDGFLSIGNLMNIIRQTSLIAIMAVGMTFVLSTGEIDLSIGSGVGLCAVTTALVLRSFNNIFLTVFVVMIVGITIGVINGLLTTKVKIPSFLVTLGMMSILLGTSRWVSGLKSITITNDTFSFIFGGGTLGVIPVTLLWTAAIVTAGHLTLKKVAFGRKVLATGGNRLAAVYTGIKVDRVKIMTFMIMGVAVAIAGMLYAGRLQSARYTVGSEDLLTVVAAVIIGGTSLFGGKGTVIGSLFGALLLAIINNGLILLGMGTDQQIITRGIIIILAVSTNLKKSADA